VSPYWQQTRAPRYSVSFAVPLLVTYEVLAFTLSHGAASGVRNGADVLLKSVFVLLGGRLGWAGFGVVLAGAAAASIWLDYRRSRVIRTSYFGWMALESLAYGLSFGLIASALTGLLLPSLNLLWGGPARPVVGQWALPVQLMISLGAGIYEELLFRVILVSLLAWLARKGLGWPSLRANMFAVCTGAILFSVFHYLGPYGDRWGVASFTFRVVAGLLFSGLYVLRGFGITAWTHALYDIFLTV
jgi:membrane protease YdiL (CAAX protease family)